MAEADKKQPDKPGPDNGAEKPGPDKPARKPDEDPVGKVYDSRLVRRLAGYVRPYWIQATVAKDGKFTVVNGRNGFSKTYVSR